MRIEDADVDTGSGSLVLSVPPEPSCWERNRTGSAPFSPLKLRRLELTDRIMTLGEGRELTGLQDFAPRLAHPK